MATTKPLTNTVYDESRFCLHISAGHFRAPKVCMLNQECFHCSFDQWLDLMDIDNGMGKEPKGGAR